jgi:hypothetical protein
MSSFYCLIKGMTCKKHSCDGKAVLIPFKKVHIPFLLTITKEILTGFQILYRLLALKEKNILLAVLNGIKARNSSIYMLQFHLQLTKLFSSNLSTKIQLYLMISSGMIALVPNSVIHAMESRKSVVSN